MSSMLDKEAIDIYKWVYQGIRQALQETGLVLSTSFFRVPKRRGMPNKFKAFPIRLPKEVAMPQLTATINPLGQGRGNLYMICLSHIPHSHIPHATLAVTMAASQLGADLLGSVAEEYVIDRPDREADQDQLSLIPPHLDPDRKLHLLSTLQNMSGVVWQSRVAVFQDRKGRSSIPAKVPPLSAVQGP